MRVAALCHDVKEKIPLAENFDAESLVASSDREENLLTEGE